MSWKLHQYIINSLNARKAFGPGSIPNNFLKLFKNELSKAISLLAISLDTSMFPNILERANITPIFKKDDPTLCVTTTDRSHFCQHK